MNAGQTSPRGALRKMFGGGLSTLGHVWLLASAGLVAFGSWTYISDSHSCSDFSGMLTPTLIVALLAIPGFILVFTGQRTVGADASGMLVRAVLGWVIVVGACLASAGLWPRPGLPCDILRGSTRTELLDIEGMQEQFKAKSTRYASSLAELGLDTLVERNVLIRIVWADSTSWGAYATQTWSRHPVPVFCAIVRAPPNNASDRVVEGVGRMQNGCWDTRHPTRFYPDSLW